MKLAIVILNWNGRPLLEQFLPSVTRHSPNTAIYVADNGSTDGSLEFLTSHFPAVQQIANSGNLGFAGGYNQALAGIEADILCLLNNDVEVTENWMTPIMDCFNSESETAIIQPKILDYKRNDYFEYAGAAGGFIDAYGYPYCRGRIFTTIEADSGQYNDRVDIQWASGACFFIRKSCFDSLGGFDTSYFAHMEEIDLCWRARNHGYAIRYVGDSEVYHLGGATLDNSDPRKTYLNFRNSLYTLVKNASAPLFPKAFVRLALDGLACLKFLFEFKFRHILAVLRSHVAFYWNLGRLLRQRRQAPKHKNYFHKTSIVWSYFVSKKRTFNRL